MDFSQLKNNAKNALQGGKWSTFTLCILIYSVINSIASIPSVFSNIIDLISQFGGEISTESGIIALISGGISSIIGGVVNLFILPIFTYGLYSIALKVQKGEEIAVSDLFDGFKNYLNIFLMSLLQSLFIFLWSLLFIVPGIIKALSYSMAYFIMAEDPDIKPMEALKKSSELMEGHKEEFFCLQLSFFGWFILNLFTCGLLGLWYEPYLYTTYAEFYQSIKEERYGTDDYDNDYGNISYSPEASGAPAEQE